MALISLDNVSLAYGHVPLLDKVAMQVDPGERVCLIGRNGAGKSTLLKLISGQLQADDGSVWRRDGLRVAYLAQDVPVDDRTSVFDAVAGGLERLGELISAYHHAARQLAEEHSEERLTELSRLQQALEAQDGWRLEQRVEAMVSRFNLDADKTLAELSGGTRRRVLLARALVTDPELLLLDEPTNHLDIEAITWLEEFLTGFNGSLVFITHDRAFLQRLATRIIELDRGVLSSWPGDYRNYLRRKEEQLAAEAQENARFDKKLAQEEVWIRQGIKARRTRNEGRVRALKAMRDERSQRRERQGSVSMNLERGDASGKIVVEVEHASAGYGGEPLVRDFSTRIMRGDRVGIVGPNGVGKSTLIRLLLGQLEPSAGMVRLGTRLQVAYFDQQREQLDPEASVLDNLNQGRDTVTINGQTRHVISYLQDFLFPPQRVRSPVKSLSGGERNRLLLARLFTRPANLLVLDEPTNDLDVETLELLEELLGSYDGTLLLVSHDRAFLDNVVTSTLVFEGRGQVNEYVGGYEDWLRQRPAATAPKREASPAATNQVVVEKPREAVKRSVKLSYKDQRELDALPARIEALEQEQDQLQQEMSDPAFYQRAPDVIAKANARLAELEQELGGMYERWEALEDG